MKKIFTLIAISLPLLLTSCLKDEVYGGATVSDLKNTPAYDEKTVVDVTVKVTSLVPVKSVTLFYTPGTQSTQSVEMHQTDENVYTAQIPGYPLETSVSYYVSARTESMETLSGTATYIVGAAQIDYSGLRLNELNGNEKFIEIYNAGKEAVPMAGVFTVKDAASTADAANWVCDDRTLAPGEYLLLYSEDVCGGDGAHAGYEPALIFHSGLSAKKAVRIRLCNPNGQVIDDFNLVDCKMTAPASYSRNADGVWYHSSATPGTVNVDGTDKVEGLADPEIGVEPTPEEPDQPDQPDQPGQPGQPDQPVALTIYKVYINEVSCGEKKIELYNSESKEIDIAGYKFIKDDADEWVVPEGLGKIAAGGYVVYTAKQSDVALGPGFGLSGTKGFKIELKADETTIDVIDNKTAVVTIEDTETYGRSTDGGAEWVLFSTGTIGASNATGVIKGQEGTPKVTLNEVNGNDKYVELYNMGDGAADLTGWQLSKDGKVVWTASDASQCTLAAGAYLAIDFVKKSVDPTQAASGLSAGKNLQILLLDAAGATVDSFERGAEGAGWGETELPENAEASFSRIPDGVGAWAYAAPTKGAANGEKVADIEQEPAPNGKVVLNELNGTSKFIELYYTGTVGSISLAGWQIFKDDGTEATWTGAEDLKIGVGEYVLLYSEDVTAEGGDKAGYSAALTFHSGLSPKKGLKIELKSADGASVDVFTRGATIGGKVSEVKDSYGRVPDGGEWKVIAATPGAANGESLGDIPQE